MKIPTHIIIHHTAVSYDKNPDQWKATDNYHKAKGWGGGGYSYEISKVGGIHQFREDGAVTAAQYQQNLNDGRAISICLDGNFDIEIPTIEQTATVAKLIKEKMQKYNIKPENVWCHRKVAQYKSCPGKKLPDNILNFFIMNGSAETPSDYAKESWAKNKALGVISELSNPHEMATKEWVIEVMERKLKLQKPTI